MSIWFFIAIVSISIASICINAASLVKAWRNSHPTKLNLCPRCGTSPRLLRVGDNRDLWVCTCMECGYTPAKNGEARSTIRGAVKVWNKGEYHGDS